MINSQTGKVVIYVAPWFSDVSEQALRCVVEMPGVRLVVITKERETELSGFIRRRLSAYYRTKEVFESNELLRLARKLTSEVGPISRIFGDAEEIQVPLAKVRDVLGISGMRYRETLNFRDKLLMKSILLKHGIRCARHQLVKSMAQARRASINLGFPLVVKPRAGLRCTSTYRVDNLGALEVKVGLVLDKHGGEALLEEYIHGNEYSCETLSLNGTTRWQSISHYHPTPLEATRDRLGRFTIVLPKSVSSSRDVGVKKLCQRVLSALGMTTGISHVEYFRLRDGSALISDVAARPPGAKILDLLKWAHGVDIVERWVKLMILDRFQAIPPRRFAAGVFFLRSGDSGKIVSVPGIRKVQHELGGLIVAKELPWVGQRIVKDYEGNGTIIVRDSSAVGVRRALATINARVRLRVD